MALKLQNNIPVTLSLTRADPRPYTHEGGRQSFMYSITYPDGTNDKAFLTPSCSETIQQMRIKPGEQFTLCKRKTGEGKEFFEVHTCANSQRTGQIASAPRAAATATHEQPQRIEPRRATSLMGAALIAAIDAARQAEEYAASKGIPLEFRPEDLRCIANTLYIQACKDPMVGERAA
jgi:hypothetical protein